MYSEICFRIADLHSDNGVVNRAKMPLAMALSTSQTKTHSTMFSTGSEAVGSVEDVVSVLIRFMGDSMPIPFLFCGSILRNSECWA